MDDNEYVVNAYITLKLEKGKTNIYVKGELFNQCKRVVFNIPINRLVELDEINSIDEATDIYKHSLTTSKIAITPEQEFMAHCSNLQVWVEHEYDTRLLHSNLAFPLLEKLFDAGDPLAKKRFKEEIVIRFESGYPSMPTFLINRNYLQYFTNDEINTLFHVYINNKDT